MVLNGSGVFRGLIMLTAVYVWYIYYIPIR